MCWKQITKWQKTFFIIFLYLTVYLIISYAISPPTKITFIGEEFRIGDKYVVMFLIAPKMSVLLDSEGADVFTSQNCGDCFITNNRGFLPLSEYDAVLIHGKRSFLTETSAFMEPGKRYLMEANQTCIEQRLKNCIQEPLVTSIGTRKSYSLCGLCKNLLKKKRDL